MIWVWFSGPTERNNVESIYAFVHQLIQVKTGVMDWDIGQGKRVQSRSRTLVLILAEQSWAEQIEETHNAHWLANQSLSAALYVWGETWFPLWDRCPLQLQDEVRLTMEASWGTFLFSCLPNEQLVSSFYLLTYSFLPPWVPPSFGSLKEGFLTLKCSQPLCVKCPRGEAGSMMAESESSGFGPRLHHLGVLWTLPLRASTASWIIAKIKQTGSWKGLGR